MPPRGHGGGPAWLTASELEDREDILQDKVIQQCRACLERGGGCSYKDPTTSSTIEIFSGRCATLPSCSSVRDGQSFTLGLDLPLDQVLINQFYDGCDLNGLGLELSRLKGSCSKKRRKRLKNAKSMTMMMLIMRTNVKGSGKQHDVEVSRP